VIDYSAALPNAFLSIVFVSVLTCRHMDWKSGCDFEIMFAYGPTRAADILEFAFKIYISTTLISDKVKLCYFTK
jgi:hypothetical protein